ncbi:hypothetical protein C8Q80DRAFT_1269876 [Daedaleopsis nitida]|nr:hypothetical protein C8Q80DRAFT_1269876 [Daedaleopsis nitida]
MSPVEDRMYPLGNGSQPFLRMFERMWSKSDDSPYLPQTAPAGLIPLWTSSPRSHPKSTRLSNIRAGVSISATAATPLARIVLQARCDVSAREFPRPTGASVSSDSSTLAIMGQASDVSCLSIYLLDKGHEGPNGSYGGYRGDRDSDHEDEGKGKGEETENDDNLDRGGERAYQSRFYSSISLDTGFSSLRYQIAMDTPHKLAIVGDRCRTKTFFWGRAGDAAFDSWKPGRGAIAVWDVEGLATQRDAKGVDRDDADSDYEDDSEGDAEDDTPVSVGAAPSRTIKVSRGEEGFAPAVWRLHEPTGNMLAGENARITEGRYGCYALDLEHDARKVVRFLGHGGSVETFSHSPGDGNVFATGCTDGYARLFDVRHPLPVMTLDVGQLRDFCSTVLLIHPDGVPVLFTGSVRAQNVKAWDIRACSAVYELGTGNNAVHALAWDAGRSALYAATECEFRDHYGYSHGYRPARIPPWAQDFPDEFSTAEVDDEEYDSDDDGERYWPGSGAQHDETYFGYAYDAGDHVLLRYGFKEDTDLTEIPEYGQATLERAYY